MKISTDIQTTKTIDKDGNETVTTVEKTRKIEVSTEPDYIKLYTEMWCLFNEIPIVWRELFLQLVVRMTYCNTNDLKHSQIVYIGKPVSDEIRSLLNWQERMYYKGLKALCDCNALKKINKGVYQINPAYAGKGEWKYNPRLNRGGIEDLIATFNFRDKTVNTEIIWADDGNDNELNKLYRQGLNIKSSDKTIIKETNKTKE